MLSVFSQVSSLENRLPKSFVHFFLGLFVFLMWTHRSPLRSRYKSFTRYAIYKYFAHVFQCLLTFCWFSSLMRHLPPDHSCCEPECKRAGVLGTNSSSSGACWWEERDPPISERHPRPPQRRGLPRALPRCGGQRRGDAPPPKSHFCVGLGQLPPRTAWA